MYNANGESSKNSFSFQEFKHASCQTPGVNVKMTRRSSTSKARPTRPTSLYVVKNEQKPPKHRKRSQSIDIPHKSNQNKKHNFDKIQKLKEKLLSSNPDVDVNDHDDNESTPLVSELSSCNVSPDRRGSPSSSSSKSPVSPIYKPRKIKSTTQTRSELNLTDITELSPSTSLQENSIFGVKYIEDLNTVDQPRIRLRTMSECVESSPLLGSLSKLLTASNISLFSQRSQGSSHLVRQTALDSKENMNDYLEPESNV